MVRKNIDGLLDIEKRDGANVEMDIIPKDMSVCPVDLLV